LTLTFPGSAQGENTSKVKHVLFFSKASSWEQKIVHRVGDKLSFLETAVQKLGQENNIDFTFSKDGTMFTPENIAKFDAFFFFTSGDLTAQQRNGRGDNYPLMTLEGKKAFLDAIQNGKGFIGCNTAVYTFIEPLSPREKDDGSNARRYTKMIGAGYIGHNEMQNGYFIHKDNKFPGMEKVPADYLPFDQWYAFKNFMPDLHVIMALDSAKLTGNLYGRPNYPIAWARMEGKGRVFYTTMGHTAEIWEDPVFLQMLLGGIRWAAGMVDADITPDITDISPQANEIPKGAIKFIPSNPPLPNPHFPNFNVWLPNPKSN
jgi:type 1 glutamine amidotransferase